MNWVGTALQERSGTSCSDGAFNLDGKDGKLAAVEQRWG